MSFWDIWSNLTQTEQIEIIIWLLVWFLISTMPFLAAAIALKKRVKVARIDIHAFILYYIMAIIIIYFIINIWYDPTPIFAYCSGIFVGILLMFVVFNKISEGVKRAYIIQLTIEETNADVNLCYIYEYQGYRCIIRLDSEGHEAFSALWGRLIHGKRIFLLTEGSHFEFTEHKINSLIFCTEWDWDNEVQLNLDGELKQVRALTVVPIPATEYSLIDFLAKFRSFKKYVRKIADLNKENIELRANIYLLAGKIFKEWVAHTEGSIWGENVKTTDDLIDEFNKEFDKLPQSSNIISEAKKETKEDTEGKAKETEKAEEGEEPEPEDEGEEAEDSEEAEQPA